VDDDAKRLVVAEANRLRKDAGSPPMIWDDRLERAAITQRDDCVRRRAMDHMGSDGSSPWDRIKASGFPVSGDGLLDTGSEGQGLGYGPRQPPLDDFAAETKYKYVPGLRTHATDLLNPRYNRIAAAGPAAGWPIWVVVYGHADDAHPPPCWSF
jgi:uncharacterized protein YkwD